jgi:hypothetical protein
MARWLGTPYATTVRHLVRLKMITQATETAWLKYSPATLKADLAPGLPLGAHQHVHVLKPSAHGSVVHVAAGDCLLLDIPSATFTALPTGLLSDSPESSQLSLLGLTSARQRSDVAWVTGELKSDAALTAETDGATDLFQVTLRRTPTRNGSDEFWD